MASTKKFKGSINLQDHMMMATRALSEWSLEGARLEGSRVWANVIFRVSKDARTYILRIHRFQYHTLEELNSEFVWIAALREYGLNVPEPLLTKDGQGYIITECVPESDEIRYISVLKWVEGSTLGSALKKSKYLHEICYYYDILGNVMAKIHNQSSTWNVPEGFTRHAFDVEGLVGDSPTWGPFWALPQLQPKQCELFKKIREVIGEILSAYGKTPDTYGMIHADLSGGNIVMNNIGYPPHDVMYNNKWHNSKCFHVIDFDDSGFGWYQHDFAIALSRYQFCPTFPKIAKAFFNGYRKYRALDEESISLLPLFILVKTLTNLSWAQQRLELILKQDILVRIKTACREVNQFLAGEIIGVNEKV